ncbi:Nine Cysteines Domain of family 3 GPCR [Popillia japonica]|uniref:Nine Cysteines Domain of family 3 GPCR n=1 Tax=Popillia japonica TaxID=7064 RepID=A0AAW1M595_POPJA
MTGLGDQERKRGPLIGVLGPGASSVALQVQNLLQLFQLPQVLGPGASSVALQVQNLLQLFQLPQIGYSTTSKDLSDKSRFSYFLRVVPSDYYQAQVILDILKSQGWTYVSAVNTDENYGQAGILAFRELAADADVCIAKEDTTKTMDKRVIRTLAQDQNAVVVVCFCEGLTVRGLLHATQRLNMTNRFLFIGSDGWGDRTDVILNVTTEAWGSLSIKIHSPYVEEFTSYYRSLHPNNNSRNSWFREFWQEKFNCTLKADDLSRKHCGGHESIDVRYRQDSKLSFVIKAIYSFAHALHTMQRHICGKNFLGVCNEMQTFNGSLFKEHLMNVSFKYKNETIEFDENGDPPGRYDILNYQHLGNGSYDYVNVGSWHDKSLTLFKPLQFKTGTKVTSVCSKPCGAGQYAQIENKKCCWTCINCARDEILKEQSCEKCREGTVPNTNHTVCEELPIVHIEWHDPEAITTTVLSVIGIIATTCSLIIFIKYNNTPVVKSSTRELSYIILIGMMLAYVSVFPIMAKPSLITCALCRFMPGLGFAMMYGALLTKTNRIARILAGSKKRFPTKKRLFMSTASQLCITLFLIGVEVSVSVWMLLQQPPGIADTYKRTKTIRECNTTAQGITVPLTYIFFLILLCTLYALKTRNVPENFNEAKFIGFAMYTTCVIWIAFFSIYFGSDAKRETNIIVVQRKGLYHVKPEKILSGTVKWTLSCQTGVELLSVLLNPKSLIDLHPETKTYVPRITEQTCCPGNECELRNITIRLPDTRF